MKEKMAVEDVMGVPLEGWEWLRQKISDYTLLTKLRLSFLVLITALAGFFLGSDGPVQLGLLLCFGAGNLLVVAGANAFNEVIERDYDALMRRTANRPLPAGRVGVGEALAAATVMSVVGLLLLIIVVNLLTGFLAALALATYVFVYTPLKRKSTWCTFVGAISGAIPPVMGWTAARNEIGPMAWMLFAILFLWQFPHFWAIAWAYRDDYAHAGFQMLPVIDSTGQRTGRQVFVYSVLLLLTSLTPAILGLQGPIYFFGALGLGLILIGYGIRLWAVRSRPAARQLMLASIVYLPVLLTLMIFGKK
jgi:protoheme IX farnesyltransferase